MKSIRLGKGTRDDIVYGVMLDTPSPKFREQAEKALRKYLHSLLPTFVQTMIDSKEMNQFLVHGSIYWNFPLGTTGKTSTISMSVLGLPNNYGVTVSSLPPALVTEIVDLLKRQIEAEIQRDKLRMQVKGIVSKYSTSAKLLADYPDFEKYLPIPPEPAMPIAIATDTLKELELLGWNPNKRGNPSSQ